MKTLIKVALFGFSFILGKVPADIQKELDRLPDNKEVYKGGLVPYATDADIVAHVMQREEEAWRIAEEGCAKLKENSSDIERHKLGEQFELLLCYCIMHLTDDPKLANNIVLEALRRYWSNYCRTGSHEGLISMEEQFPPQKRYPGSFGNPVFVGKMQEDKCNNLSHALGDMAQAAILSILPEGLEIEKIKHKMPDSMRKDGAPDFYISESDLIKLFLEYANGKPFISPMMFDNYCQSSELGRFRALVERFNQETTTENEVDTFGANQKVILRACIGCLTKAHFENPRNPVKNSNFFAKNPVKNKISEKNPCESGAWSHVNASFYLEFMHQMLQSMYKIMRSIVQDKKSLLCSQNAVNRKLSVEQKINIAQEDKNIEETKPTKFEIAHKDNMERKFWAKKPIYILGILSTIFYLLKYISFYLIKRIVYYRV